MAFYDLDKPQRLQLVEKIKRTILSDISSHSSQSIIKYFSDDDTYIRKTAYLAIGRIYKMHANLKPVTLNLLTILFKSPD